MTLVLVVDDVQAMAEQYAYDLKRLGGFETLVATDGADGLDRIGSEAVDCVILDLEMPGTDGFDVLRALRERKIDVPVIVYTGTGNYDRCVEAVKLGAMGFVDKTESMERIVHEIERALETRRLRARVASLEQQFTGDSSLIGSSKPMEQLTSAIGRVAPIPSPVLITGESGSGKELVAREVHRLYTLSRRKELGRRSEPPFVAVNCAALPESLVESELFGHERGAFTGANALRQGAFESAGNGTLFLDEVGELPLAQQAKLLRVLEQREITRVGGNRTVAVNARVVAATNRDLADEVKAGRFREDLHYRLNVHTLAVPPLRDRRSDIPEIVAHFLTAMCARFAMRPKTISPAALHALMEYDWGHNNVRELRNAIERMVIAADGETLEVTHVPAEVGTGTGDTADDAPKSFAALKAEAERRIVVEALERNDWQVTKTAQELGLADHASLLKIMRRHGVKRER